MLEFKEFTLQRGKKVLLDHASVRIELGQRVGLIGRNGAGKSSLMAVMTGQEEAEGGYFRCDIQSESIAYLEQALPDVRLTAIEFIKSGDQKWVAIQANLNEAEEIQDGVRIAECYVALQEIDGYTIDARAAQIAHGLGFSNEDLSKRVGEFSGGWQMRLQLAKVLLSRAALLLLDEPTNHLDLEAIAWFEKWLLEQSCQVILISHDRDFLDNVCTQILHLSQEKLKLYNGNYTDFVRQFELQLEIESREREKIIKQKEHMQKFVDRFRYKATKARQAQSRMKAIEKLTIAPGVQRENPFHFSFKPCVNLSSPILKIEGDAGYPNKKVISHLKLNVMAEDRIALLGINGAGKSTFIKTMSGHLPLLVGAMTHHPKMNVGYFSQQQLDALDYDSTPIAHMLLQNKGITESQARTFLGGFNIMGDRVLDPVRSFSGGEQARLALALLIYKAPNILLLDEPTNHLDIEMREALIIALQAYEGALILVSHDRYFVNSVVDQLWWVASGRVAPFEGNLDDYQKFILEYESENKKSSIAAVTPKKTQTDSSINPQKLKKLEEEIENLTQEQQDLEAQLASAILYLPENAAQLKTAQSRLQQVLSDLLAAEARWFDALLP
jgi:ATP-binding cassette subfamily F protein 3